MTHVNRSKGFLEIYGHKKPEILTELQSYIAAYHPTPKRRAQLLFYPKFDTIYLAYTQGLDKFHRCVVVEKYLENRSIIELIDYGQKFEVNNDCVSIENKNNNFHNYNEFQTIFVLMR